MCVVGVCPAVHAVDYLLGVGPRNGQTKHFQLNEYSIHQLSMMG